MSVVPAEPVVLLHGCGGSTVEAFVDPGWVEALRAAGREARVPDLPGHGGRPCSHDPRDYADLAGSLVDAMPPGRFDLVGFSLGAKLSLELVLRLPGRVRRVVLGGLGDNVFAPERVAPAAATALEQGPTADTPPPVMAFLREWNPARNDALAVAAVLRRPANPVFTPERLRAVTVPLLLVNGSEDPVGTPAAALVAALPDLRVITLPGTGHFDLTRDPRFQRHAHDFLVTPGLPT